MTRSELRAERLRWRRGDALAALGAVLLGLVLAGVFFSIRDLQHDLVVANGARDALARQVQGLGATPVAGKPGSRGDIGPSGPSGSPGPSGASGSPGRTGADGKDGSDGSDGTDGASATGSPGAAGASGAPGVAGPAGPQGEPGPAGKDGSDGQDGSDGADGQDGQTCPDGYTLQTPSWDADALVCRREGSSSPSDEPSPSSSSLALDPQRRQYA